MIALAVLALATAEPPPGPPAQPQSTPSQTASSAAGGGAQVIADFRIAQAERGPLEGLWRVSRGDAPLYLIALADPDGRAASATSPALEGAWGDLRRTAAPEGSGYLAGGKRLGRRLTLLFYEGRGGGARSLELAADGRGGWRGDMVVDGQRTPVVMRRDRLFATLGAASP